MLWNLTPTITGSLTNLYQLKFLKSASDMFFSKTPKQAKVPWQQVESAPIWDQIKVTSEEKPVVLFKHSPRCGTSRMVLKTLESNWPFQENEVSPYLLDVVQYRNLAQKVAKDTHVWHESPQVIMLWRSIPIYHAAHYHITAPDLSHAFRSTPD